MKNLAGLRNKSRIYFFVPHIVKKTASVMAALLLAGSFLMLPACAEKESSSSRQPLSSQSSQVSDASENSTSLPEASKPADSSADVANPGAAKENMNAQDNINPFTGLPVEGGLPADTRPVAIMVDGKAAARPQRGVSDADMVLEMLCEDGYSNMMLFFANPASIPSVGPVCSTRDQFIQFAMPVNAIPAHIGSTIYASNLLNLHSYQDLDGVYIGKIAFAFDTARSRNPENPKGNEYCWFTDAPLIQAGIGHTALPPTGQVKNMFSFSEKEIAAETPASAIDIKYWSNSSAQLIYDGEQGKYTKNTAIGEGAHCDENGVPMTFNNVIVLVTEVTKKPDNYCAEYNLTEGKGYYFTKGSVMEIVWVKGMPADPLLLYSSKGDVLEINKGKTYLAVAANDGEAYVSYS